MKITSQEYKAMAEQCAPRSGAAVNTACAFGAGGCICAVGELIRNALYAAGFADEEVGMWTSVILVLASALLTGLGIYPRIARHAGAGTLVPITGFANAISSSAIEAQSEGMVTGVGAKIFTIAGPVILYGCTAAFMYGTIYYLLN